MTTLLQLREWGKVGEVLGDVSMRPTDSRTWWAHCMCGCTPFQGGDPWLCGILRGAWTSPHPASMSLSGRGEKKEGKSSSGAHLCNQGPRSIPETDGGLGGAWPWRGTGRRHIGLRPHFHLTTTVGRGGILRGEGGNFTRGETEAGQGWDLLSFLLLMSSRGMI